MRHTSSSPIALEGDSVVVDEERSWTIHACAHGCLHVELDRVVVTLTTDEFHALQHLMRRACQQFHGAPVAGERSH